ncbi:MAG TPA: hypothetical protein PLJ60_21050 [Chryseolinea sp.]|nr:hypothetical protein [Chryseolinea sp.]HPM32834.1 hypothetical protein [Chryseolinea sp.]
MTSTIKKVIVLCIFSVAMAALESAVVVYLRALYYPDGFTVAFKLIDQHILLVEIARELATLIMLVGVAYLAGVNRYDRFAFFLLSFAVWDIFYYVWLKVFIDWPTSFFECDILFLIPITWLGPVMAPIICSITMIILSVVILRKYSTQTKMEFSFLVSSCLFVGSLLILITFMQDYVNLLIVSDSLRDYPNLLRNERFISAASAYTPESYNWFLFIVGELIICIGIFKSVFRG